MGDEMALPETVVEQPQAAPRRTLRRNLTVWQAVGLSIALMAPSMAASAIELAWRMVVPPSRPFAGGDFPL